VKDFSIKADYVFWSKVGATSAKEIQHLQQQRNQELTCSMKLVLPDLMVDIMPWQFYVMLNVVRNVLLVPPPVIKGKRAEMASERDVDAGSKVTELKRETRRPGAATRVAPALDIANHASRVEIKDLVQQFIRSKREVIPGSGRVLELSMGRCMMVLRPNVSANASAAASSSDSLGQSAGLLGRTAAQAQAQAQAQGQGGSREGEAGGIVEMGLSGVQASIKYGEDSCQNIKFEIQRFWARNLDPGPDTSTFKNKTVLMMPTVQQLSDRCTRCKQTFSIDENRSDSCCMHLHNNKRVLREYIAKWL
jgi:hypothetical protein